MSLDSRGGATADARLLSLGDRAAPSGRSCQTPIPPSASQAMMTNGTGETRDMPPSHRRFCGFD